MDDLLTILILIFGLGGLIVFATVMAVRLYTNDQGAIPKETPTEPECTPQTFRATVVDMGCAVRTEGWKTPKTVRDFMVVFQTEDGQRLSFPVPEEMYDGFEKGQTGTLTLVDGQLYSFQPESPEL